MENPKITYLLTKLISYQLNSVDNSVIQVAIKQASEILSSQIRSSIQPAKFWEKRWKLLVSEENKNYISHYCHLIPSNAYPMLRLLNCLRSSKPKNLNFKIQNSKSTESSSRLITDQEIVDDLFILLEGGNGNFIKFSNGKFKVEKGLSKLQKSSIQPALKLILALNSIISSRLPSLGLIGQRIFTYFENEIQKFISDVSSLPENISLLSFGIFCNSPSAQKVFSLSYLHHSLFSLSSSINFTTSDKNQQKSSLLPGKTKKIMFKRKNIKNSNNDNHSNETPSIQPKIENICSFLNLLFKIQAHGSPFISSYSQMLFNSALEIEIEFIRDWTVSGILNDPYEEFFIAASKDNFLPSQWWNSKYFLIQEKIPPILLNIRPNNNQDLISLILSSGKAWNFLQTFQKTTETIQSWKKGIFRIEMIEKYAKDAMKAMMHFLYHDLWITGYFRVFYEFILFGRGDFASTLYSLFTNNPLNHDCATILNQTKFIVGKNSILYSNPQSGKNLLDYLDIKIFDVKHISAKNIALVFKISSPLDVIFNEEIIAGYYRISHLLWRVKCIENQLAQRWNFKDGEKFLSILEEDSEIDHIITCQSFIILQTIHQIAEYISGDVIYYSWLQFQKDLENISDFDSLCKVHKDYIFKMIKGSLIGNEDIENELGQLLIFSEKFIGLIDIYQNIFIQITNAAQAIDFEKAEAEMFEKVLKQINYVKESLPKICHSFKSHLQQLYKVILSFPEDEIFISFVSRIRSCIQ